MIFVLLLVLLAAPAWAAFAGEARAPDNRAVAAEVFAHLASRNVTAPQIAGAATVDELLAATPGEWTGAPRLRFQWLRCTSVCVEIPGATAQTHRLVGADAGATLRVRVTDARGGEATSAPTGPVQRRTYTQILCADPATGQGVGGDGVLPAGMTPWAQPWQLGNMTERTRCSGTMTLSRGIPVRPQYWIRQAGWPNDGAVLRYRAPASVRFEGARIHRRLDLAGSTAMAAGITTGSEETIQATPSIERCEVLRGCAGIAAAITSPWAAPVTVPASGEINGFDVWLRCASTSTCAAEPHHGYTVYGGTATLRDTADPQLSAAPTGTLVSDPAIADKATLAFAATDAGSGLYRVRVRLDDQVVDQRVVGGCESVGDAAFAAPAPCAATATTSLTFDTSAWPRGARRLHVVLEDAGGNTVLLVDREVTLGTPDA